MPEIFLFHDYTKAVDPDMRTDLEIAYQAALAQEALEPSVAEDLAMTLDLEDA